MAKKTATPEPVSETVKTSISPLQVISFCQENQLDAELVGKWVWVTFAAKPAREIRDQMRLLGFIYSSRRRKWAHNCGIPSKSAMQSDPFEKYPRKHLVR